MAGVRRLGVTSLTAIGDPAAREVVRRELDVDVVARRDADAEPAQAPCEARQDGVAVLELDLERGAGERLDDAADAAERIFFDDGGQGLAALFTAAALASARRGNGSSFGLVCTEPYARSRSYCWQQSLIAFAPADGFARAAAHHGDRFRRPERRAQRNFPAAPAVSGLDMITGAIVFGMVGVAAGFTWDYVINRGK